MNSQSLSALLAAIVTFAIGFSVVLRDRAQRPFQRFATLCFNLCIYQFASFLRATLSSRPVLADVMYVVSLAAAVLLPISSLRFFRSFLKTDPRRRPPAPSMLTLMAAGLLVALSYALVFYAQGFHHATAFTVPLTVFVFGGLAVSLLEIYATWRRTLSRVEKTRLFYLFVGGAASIALAAGAVMPDLGLGLPLQSLGNVLLTVYIYFLSQTLLRYRLLDLNELLGRMAVLATFVLILAAIYSLLVAWIPSDQRGVLFFNTVVASFVIVILFEPLRSGIEGQVNRVMFREKYELGLVIDDLRARLANVIDVREAVRIVIDALDESRRVTHASVYFVDADGSGYELQGHLGPKPAERVDAAARRPFIERLTSQKGGQTVSLEQLEREHAGRLPDDPANETLDAIARALDEVHAGVCVPIIAGDQLLGLLCLKDERLREAFASDEIDLFRALAAQMGITLQNSKLYDRMKERDRLAAIGEMAAGLAHEIRNPLGAIKGAAQFLAPPPSADGAGEGEDPQAPAGAAAATSGDARQFLDIIVEEVNRLNRVVSQFLDYARPYRGDMAQVDLNDVVRRSAQLVATEADGKVDIQVACDESNPRVRADPEQLRQVFLNLAINAMQAMPEGGKLTISTGVRKTGRKNAPQMFAEVRFKDTGGGIPPADIKNLFIPFFTTKEKGTGLGLPISQRIIANHGGNIEVRSRAGVGSTFTVVLPQAEKEDEKEREKDKSGKTVASGAA